jgi:hypothetical protein
MRFSIRALFFLAFLPFTAKAFQYSAVRTSGNFVVRYFWSSERKNVVIVSYLSPRFLRLHFCQTEIGNTIKIGSSIDCYYPFSDFLPHWSSHDCK